MDMKYVVVNQVGNGGLPLAAPISAPQQEPQVVFLHDTRPVAVLALRSRCILPESIVNAVFYRRPPMPPRHTSFISLASPELTRSLLRPSPSSLSLLLPSPSLPSPSLPRRQLRVVFTSSFMAKFAFKAQNFLALVHYWHRSQ